MTELTNILGKSYDNADFLGFQIFFLKKILGKSYEKLTNILQKS